MSKPESLSMVATLLTTEGDQIDVSGKAADYTEAQQKIDENLTSEPGQPGWRKKLVGAQVLSIAITENNDGTNILSRSF